MIRIKSQLDQIPNYAPLIYSPPVNKAIVGLGYEYNIKIIDPHGSAGLTLTLAEAPQGMTIPSNKPRQINWTPGQAGVYPVTINVSDGMGGNTTQSFNIQVEKLTLPISVDITADPLSVAPGETTTLSWSSPYATSVNIDNGIGTRYPDGSIDVIVNETTTYTITANGLGNSATDSVTVYAATPSVTTIYTITATGPGGQTTENITVNVVYPPPVLNLTVDPGNIIQGESAAFYWTSTYTDSLTISPDIGTVEVNGSATVTPDETTTYTFTAAGPGGSNSFDVTITVTPQPTHVTAQGIVKDALTGMPLEGATVSFTDVQQTHTAVSQNDGYYTVTGILTGSADIRVELQGYIAFENQTVFSNPGTWVFDFELLDAAGHSSVQGTIVNSKTLLPEAGVTISLEGSQNSCTTLDDGTYVLNEIPYGYQTLHIYKEDVQDSTIIVPVGMNPFEMNLAVPYRPAKTTPEQVNANPSGIITDGITGLPICGAKLSVVGKSVEVITDQDGQASLAGLAEGNALLLITALDHEAVLVFPEVASGGSETFSVRLSPVAFGTITGSAINADTGDPVHLAGINIGKGALAGAQTEPDGTYVMGNVPAGTHTVSAIHPAYETAEEIGILVHEGETATVDFVLIPRPRTGAIEGTIRDKDSHTPIPGALVSSPATGLSTTTDTNGYYRLDALPAGMVNLLVQASGYPDAECRYAVDADIDGSTPTVTVFDIDLSLTDPTGPETTSVLVTASEGANIETPDKRFQVVIPPHSLSADAVVTLMPVTSGPDVSQGDLLTLDPELGSHTVTALGQSVQIALEPVVPGDPVPTLENWVILAGRYSQGSVDSLELDEQTIFPYFWNGSNWTPMQINPLEATVDEVNNRHLAVVNFSTTQAGDPVVAELNTKTPVLLASIDDYLPDLPVARIYSFALAGRIVDNAYPHSPNVHIYDKNDDELQNIINPLQAQHHPNANGLPLLIIHGWNPKSIFVNMKQTDPSTETRYQYLIEDLVSATNGVYRPMFGTYNSRSSIIQTGSALAKAYEARNIIGIPGDAAGATGKFPFLDTFGFSMGGLVSRTFQMNHQGVHNMIMACTPNHGSLSVIRLLDALANNNLDMGLRAWSPGTADIMPYNDNALNASTSGNPTLYNLNRSPACIPTGDMTLLAGTKGIPSLLQGENDGIVPVKSVFCRTSSLFDGEDSLLKVHPCNKITEVTDDFSHMGFSKDEYRIKNHAKVYVPIQQGLSDWVVGKLVSNSEERYPERYPGINTIKSVEYTVEVQYNVWNNAYDRVALAIYGLDENGGWHIGGNYVDAVGNITNSIVIKENSKNKQLLELQTSHSFAKKDKIIHVLCELKSLRPGQTKVPLTPGANFSLP